uniref:G-protein coupled receptors family 1 profile domain-containing protein n=1 Tax=Eptatretus burgeri TaxID=7764 RepID=A0A8C4NKA0_EPTBU
RGNGWSQVSGAMFDKNDTIPSWSPRPPQTVIGILLVIVAVITTIGNMMVLAAVYRSRFFMPGFTHYFVCSLALADFLVGSLVMPLGAIYILTGSWLLGDAACALWNSMDMFATTASIDTLCVIAMDRYLAVTAPLHYPNLITSRRAHLLNVLVFLMAGAVSFLPIHFGWWRSDDPIAVSCYNNLKCCDFITTTEYTIACCLIAFYIPVTILLVLYARIFAVANKQVRCEVKGREGRRMVSSNRLTGSRENRALKTLLLIMGAFVLFWLPYFIAFAVQIICYTCFPDSVYTYTLWLGYSNSTINPLLYSRSPDFRDAYKRLLKKSDRLSHAGTGNLIVGMFNSSKTNKQYGTFFHLNLTTNKIHKGKASENSKPIHVRFVFRLLLLYGKHNYHS